MNEIAQSSLRRTEVSEDLILVVIGLHPVQSNDQSPNQSNVRVFAKLHSSFMKLSIKRCYFITSIKTPITMVFRFIKKSRNICSQWDSIELHPSVFITRQIHSLNASHPSFPMNHSRFLVKYENLIINDVVI